MEAVKRKSEKVVCLRKTSKLKEEKWERVADKKEKADKIREKPGEGKSGGKASSTLAGVKTSSSGVKATYYMATSEARRGEKKQSKEVGLESEKLEESCMSKEV